MQTAVILNRKISYLVFKNHSEGWGCGSVVEAYLACTRALGSIPRTIIR